MFWIPPERLHVLSVLHRSSKKIQNIFLKIIIFEWILIENSGSSTKEKTKALKFRDFGDFRSGWNFSKTEILNNAPDYIDQNILIHSVPEWPFHHKRTYVFEFSRKKHISLNTSI
jgi:hypothetical protein